MKRNGLEGVSIASAYSDKEDIIQNTHVQNDWVVVLFHS